MHDDIATVLTVLGAIGGVAGPILIWLMERARKSRANDFGEVKAQIKESNSRMAHLDECFDKMRLMIAAQGGVLITRAEMEREIEYERNERHKLAGKFTEIILELPTRTELVALDNRLMTELRDVRNHIGRDG